MEHQLSFAASIAVAIVAKTAECDTRKAHVFGSNLDPVDRRGM